MAADRSGDELQLLYLDWCSTQVARRFLELSHDEIWIRSRFADSLAADSSDSLLSAQQFLPLDRFPAYLDLVRNTALVLAREMNLPSFEQWRAEYLANPELYESDLMSR